jgi:hypothetical protein
MATATKGDVGFVIERLVTTDGSTPRDLSLVTVKEFHAKPPVGPAKTWTAAFTTDGKDGLLRYATVEGDLDEAGDWQIQVYIEGAGAKLHSTSAKLGVGKLL